MTLKYAYYERQLTSLGITKCNYVVSVESVKPLLKIIWCATGKPGLMHMPYKQEVYIWVYNAERSTDFTKDCRKMLAMDINVLQSILRKYQHVMHHLIPKC